MSCLAVHHRSPNSIRATCAPSRSFGVDLVLNKRPVNPDNNSSTCYVVHPTCTPQLSKLSSLASLLPAGFRSTEDGQDVPEALRSLAFFFLRTGTHSENASVKQHVTCMWKASGMVAFPENLAPSMRAASSSLAGTTVKGFRTDPTPNRGVGVRRSLPHHSSSILHRSVISALAATESSPEVFVVIVLLHLPLDERSGAFLRLVVHAGQIRAQPVDHVDDALKFRDVLHVDAAPLPSFSPCVQVHDPACLAGKAICEGQKGSQSILRALGEFHLTADGSVSSCTGDEVTLVDSHTPLHLQASPPDKAHCRCGLGPSQPKT